MRVGYTRAGRLIDMLERRGVISGYEGRSRAGTVSEADLDRVLAPRLRRYSELKPRAGPVLAIGAGRAVESGQSMTRGLTGGAATWTGNGSSWFLPSRRSRSHAPLGSRGGRRQRPRQAGRAIKVGLVTDTGGLDDKPPVEHSAWRALRLEVACRPFRPLDRAEQGTTSVGRGRVPMAAAVVPRRAIRARFAIVGPGVALKTRPDERARPCLRKGGGSR